MATDTIISYLSLKKKILVTLVNEWVFFFHLQAVITKDPTLLGKFKEKL
jgi:hypothetical protein